MLFLFFAILNTVLPHNFEYSYVIAYLTYSNHPAIQQKSEVLNQYSPQIYFDHVNLSSVQNYFTIKSHAELFQEKNLTKKLTNSWLNYAV